MLTIFDLHRECQDNQYPGMKEELGNPGSINHTVSPRTAGIAVGLDIEKDSARSQRFFDAPTAKEEA